MSWQDDDDDTIPCPSCRRAIHEDSVRCPHCEQYLSEEDAPPSRRSWWFLILALICLVLAVGWALQFL